MTKRAGQLVGVLMVLLGVNFVIGGGIVWRAADRTPMPAPTPLDVWIPAGAEIRSSSEVHPGTFFIRSSLAEFKERFPTGGLATFDDNLLSWYSVVVWREHPGSPRFYKLIQPVKIPPAWPPRFTISKLTAEDGRIIAHPTARLFYRYATLAFLAGVALAVAGIFWLMNKIAVKPADGQSVVRPSSRPKS